MVKISGSMNQHPFAGREPKSRVPAPYRGVTGVPVQEPSMRAGTNWTRMPRFLLVACVAVGLGGCGLYGTSNGGSDGTGGATTSSDGGTGDVSAGGATTGTGGSGDTVGTGGAGGTGDGAAGSIGSAGIGGVTSAGGSGATAGSPGICSPVGAVPVAAGTPTGNPVLPPRWVFGTLW